MVLNQCYLINKRYVLIFNGEIYNHWQLRKKLKCNWKGTSDSETLIELISKYGVEKRSVTCLACSFFQYGIEPKKN